MTQPSVLFVCVHNAGRSQMAAGFLKALSGGAVEVLSAGSMPADQVNRNLSFFAANQAARSVKLIAPPENRMASSRDW